MAEIQGLGNCGICQKPMQDPVTGIPSAARHYQGHQLAHKTCFEKRAAYEKTPEFQVDQARSAVETAEQKLASAQYELEVAKIKLARVIEAVESV